MSKTADAVNAALAKMPQLSARVAGLVAPQFSELARQAFDAQRSPSGESWAGSRVTLYRSGRLRAAALAFRASGAKVRSSVASVPYARFHIWRGILPRGGASLPAEWDARIRKTARAEFEKLTRGAP